MVQLALLCFLSFNHFLDSFDSLFEKNIFFEKKNSNFCELFFSVYEKAWIKQYHIVL